MYNGKRKQRTTASILQVIYLSVEDRLCALNTTILNKEEVQRAFITSLSLASQELYVAFPTSTKINVRFRYPYLVFDLCMAVVNTFS